MPSFLPSEPHEFLALVATRQISPHIVPLPLNGSFGVGLVCCLAGPLADTPRPTAAKRLVCYLNIYFYFGNIRIIRCDCNPDCVARPAPHPTAAKRLVCYLATLLPCYLGGRLVDALHQVEFNFCDIARKVDRTSHEGHYGTDILNNRPLWVAMTCTLCAHPSLFQRLRPTG